MTDSQHPIDGRGVSRRALLAGAAAGGVGLAATVVETHPAAALVGAGGPPAIAGVAAIKDPGVGNIFRLDVPGIGSFSGFQLISGLTSEVTVVQFREGDGTGTQLLPGNVVLPSISLSRPIGQDTRLAAWHELVLGEIASARQDCSLTVQSAEGQAIARYTLENAWPSKVEIGALEAGSAEVLMETVTIVCERLQRVAV